FVRDFVGTLFDAGCRVFIVHARNAWLRGLSPKENREVPPLRYDFVAQVKKDFPAATVVINGGIASLGQLALLDESPSAIDGVMLGRIAYHDPYFLAQAEQALFAPATPVPPRRAIVASMVGYAARCAAHGVPVRAITRHMLGLYQGQPGARRWRRLLSDPSFLAQFGANAMEEAARLIEQRSERLAA
ncbi:MAG TPA: tRNA-dihydrouridine synthase, partial [Burkholderiaceae bacterium]|nr:tRNA-dihydrouridine synthase [Burkholderiaceae bacterium]